MYRQLSMSCRNTIGNSLDAKKCIQEVLIHDQDTLAPESFLTLHLIQSCSTAE